MIFNIFDFCRSILYKCLYIQIYQDEHKLRKMLIYSYFEGSDNRRKVGGFRQAEQDQGEDEQEEILHHGQGKALEDCEKQDQL